jgi:uncharacterized protein YggE
MPIAAGGVVPDELEKAGIAMMITGGWLGLQDRVVEEFAKSGIDREQITFTHLVRMQYYGQLNDIEIVSPSAALETGAQIDALVGVGGDALQVQGIGYSINDSTALLAQARTDAVKRASEQAHQMADAAGVKLGGVRTISEVPLQTGYPFDQLQFSGRSAAGDVAVPLAAGSQELTLTVTVVYDIG